MKIILDAGHGGRDRKGNPTTPGKRSPDGMLEYDFNSRVADVMKAELEKYEGVTVYFAHEDYRDVPLKERTDKANRLGVDLFVSLHANANTGKMGAWGGIDTFIYKTNPASARKLAEVIQRNLIAATGLRNRGVKCADFHVLRETKMNAVLIEHGFMDSTTDLPFLKSDAYRVLCGETNVKSIAEYYGLKLKAQKVAAASTPTPSDSLRYRLATGSFGSAKALAEAKVKLLNEYKWTVYERADDTGFNPTYRLFTGTFVGKNVAEFHAEQLRKKFGWTIYVKGEAK